MSYTYPYPRPAVTADILVFREVEKHWEILLIKRKNPPFQYSWAFPGGFVEESESLETTAQRELFEEAGIEIQNVLQYKTYSHPERDPRHRTITTVFWAVISNTVHCTAGSDALEAVWFKLTELPEMAFDHKTILNEAIMELLPFLVQMKS